MSHTIRTAVGIAAAGVLVFATAASAVPPQTTAFVKRATQSYAPRTTVVPAANDPVAAPSVAELQDLGTLAESKGMSLDEAVAKYGWRDDFGKVADDLRNAYPRSFTGARSENGLARISFTGDAPPDVATKLAAARLAVPVHIQDRMGLDRRRHRRGRSAYVLRDTRRAGPGACGRSWCRAGRDPGDGGTCRRPVHGRGTGADPRGRHLAGSVA